ncbi:hypothetical protein CH276_14215 [Rhodococcus sp. 06-470-2]|uniref:hypothetical protein n=1 Tax=unclassified Rhodococcus (in: high G+C Gram-positive bacteria) TaxID=192944 RepID=UPI000B9BF54D|nr:MULTISPECIES: hypothetical protein [unclassified Rhodococcus (in: high G+C Gram-positive bacteria)]OZC62769.1 hypothetical protein CH276_14215 [Rhodococcus sp. 06-470-2]OZE71746.1 hypothetical protein CH265_01695 [Rhodococcus sp. 05-2221-1B]
MAEFATPNDISSTLTESETVDAAAKIAAVSQWITDKKPDLAEGHPQAKYVVVDVVRAALANKKYAGHTQYSRTVGGVTRSGTLVDPGGSMVITDFHKQLLGISLAIMPQYHFGDC